ncbi:MAG: hypothetical protein ABI537_08595 [Casimicrobiaceae bacterium]
MPLHIVQYYQDNTQLEAYASSPGKKAGTGPFLAEFCAGGESDVAIEFTRDALFNGGVFPTFNVIEDSDGGAMCIEVAIATDVLVSPLPDEAKHIAVVTGPQTNFAPPR